MGVQEEYVIVGYYDWEGLPCEIRAAGDVRSAVMYIPRQGFSPVSLADVQFKGTPLSKEDFKERVLRLSSLYRKALDNE